MKRVAFLFIAVIGAVIAQDFVPFDIFRRPVVESVDLSKVDFSTNEFQARVWFSLSTNSVVRKSSSQYMTTEYHSPGCGCAKCTGRIFTKTITVYLTRYAEIDGAIVTLKQTAVSSKDSTIIVE
jgi:hypothetical protein